MLHQIPVLYTFQFSHSIPSNLYLFDSLHLRLYMDCVLNPTKFVSRGNSPHESSKYIGWVMLINFSLWKFNSKNNWNILEGNKLYFWNTCGIFIEQINLLVILYNYFTDEVYHVQVTHNISLPFLFLFLYLHKCWNW